MEDRTTAQPSRPVSVPSTASIATSPVRPSWPVCLSGELARLN